MEYVVVIALVLLSGLFSGLTLGLLSLDKNDLERKISVGNKAAKKVYPIRKRGNLLLCTLLMGNVGVNSTLAIFLGNIADGVIAGFIATGLILIFGEILPQATIARYALEVGAKTTWIVRFFLIIFFPICGPIAWVLDKILGDEIPTIYSKKELMKIVEEHEDSVESELDADEERIIKGALSYSDKTVEEIMTPRTVVYALEANTKLDQKTLTTIKEEGFTRIPIYENNIDNTTGILYAKDLINIKTGTPVNKIYRKGKTLIVEKEFNLDKLLTKFIKSKNHMAFVQNEYKGLEGVVTLEDVIEEILKTEIVDETDQVPDLQKKAREEMKNKKNMKKKITLAMITVLCTISVANAHQPRITTEKKTILESPEISQAFYSELTGESHTYTVNSEKPFNLYISLLVPDIPNIGKDISATITNENPEEKFKILLDGENFNWEPYYEEHAGDDYFTGPELKGKESSPLHPKGIPVKEGTYNIEIFSPDNEGKYVFVIGEKEEFPLNEIVKTVLTIPKLKLYFEKSPLEAFTTPTMMIFLTITVVTILGIAGILQFLYKKILKRQK